jgi:putative phosphonate metabolism protein
MTARYAIYFTPPPETALARFGAGMLGYDGARGVDVPHLTIDGIAPDALAALTTEPRRYGFHATLAAPFRLGDSTEAALRAAAAALARTQPAVTLDALAVTAIGSFIALRPGAAQPGIAALEAACVRTFHPFRAPMTAAERARRLTAPLTPHQIALMDRWGYPYVLDQYRFHMTLTGPVPPTQRVEVLRQITQAYAPLAGAPHVIDAVSLMRQDDAASRFRVLERFALTG